VFCPQAASTIVRPRPAAHAAVLLVAVVLVRISGPSHVVEAPAAGNVATDNVWRRPAWCQPH
jgi:hypothetical protein